MPGFRGNGPRGEGQGTGRRLGPCYNPELDPQDMEFPRGMGRGRGRGRGGGRGFGRPPGPGYGLGRSGMPRVYERQQRTEDLQSQPGLFSDLLTKLNVSVEKMSEKLDKILDKEK
ncbi:MAG: DUF5320 domain-containing protein [Candidatus Aenigmarchaeota archaeon]|nr:DUF5320 domain-containing protein [Candidatus Aenigmarchaeota archaeon]